MKNKDIKKRELDINEVLSSKEIKEYLYYKKLLGGNKGIRRALMEKDPHCIYCAVEVKEYNLLPHQKMPDDQATIDHLYEKYDKRRYENFGFNNKVLSCAKCNHDRDLQKYGNLPKDFLRKRNNLSLTRKKGERRDIMFYELNKSL